MARSALYESFLHFTRENGLFARGENVLAAVSGGPDSVAMLDCLRRYASSGGIKLFACHLDHRLRGEESAADAEFVGKLCKSLGVQLAVAHRNVARMAAAKKMSIEAAARQARYDFFLRAARDYECAKVATAHTLTDNAETVIQRLIEGAGPAGLCGIPLSRALDAKGRIAVVRPLLFAARRDIEEYLTARRLEARVDSTNLEPLYTRNKIRLEILPRMRELNPSAEEAIARAAANIESLLRYAEPDVPAVHAKAVGTAGGRGVVLERRAIVSLPEYLARTTVRKAILASGVDGRSLAARHVDAVMRLAASRRSSGVVDLPGGVRAKASVGSIAILGPDAVGGRPAQCGIRKPGPLRGRSLRVPGRVALARGGGSIRARIMDTLDMGGFLSRKTRCEEAVDADAVCGALVVRPPLPGERFRPIGAPGAKKLSDFLIDEKVPADERPTTPVVADEAGIIWVAGHRISDRVKVTDKTKRFLHLCLQRR